MTDMTEDQRVRAEAAAFRRLIQHLQERKDVQNIDLMNLGGFCRNCLANWYREAAENDGQLLTKDDAREAIYGMPYETWKDLYQKEASDDQKASFSNQAAHK
ncbi:DUF1244 domain-containing protein [Oryzifoliimicrobium ureilyticus]|uniref:DUF1244 domain-containing protein n=1 Tax=Oryzifoliimicrobium ureilyticus TaxID=3113724 RepID=UPI0030763E71